MCLSLYWAFALIPVVFSLQILFISKKKFQITFHSKYCHSEAMTFDHLLDNLYMYFSSKEFFVCLSDTWTHFFNISTLVNRFSERADSMYRNKW